MKKFVGILITLLIAVSFTGHTQQVKPKMFDVIVAVDYLDYTLPNKKDWFTQNRIKIVTEQELAKLPDVNVKRILPGIQGQVPPEYIINILASTNDGQMISFVTLFLRRTSVPKMFIDPEFLNAYKEWNNLSPDYNLLANQTDGIPTGRCTKDRLEEYIKGDVNTFDKKILSTERVAKQFADSTIDFLLQIEKARERR